MYLRFHVLKAKDFKPVEAKAKNVVDLRPAIIAKLQQLVKNGSNGLYTLNIDRIEPDVLNSKLTIYNASLNVDSNSMRVLDQQKKLPDDIFRIKLNDLHIDGLGIDIFLHKDSINVTGIHIDKPIINVYHHNRVYNKTEREKNAKLPLYARILGTMRSISIGKIDVRNGTFILHNKEKYKDDTRLNEVGIQLGKVLIDSATQYDYNRFLFAKTASFSAKNYFLPTPDSLYVFSIGSIAVSADQHTLTAQNIKLKAKGGKQQFEKKLKFRKEMYDVSVPKLTMKGVNWWSIVNRDKWFSNQMDLFNPTMYVYLDPRIPASPSITPNNFPHQMLMKLPIPISVAKLNLHDLTVTYEELNQKIDKTGIVHFDRINGQITDISNIPAQIKKHPIAIADAKGYFMNTSAASARMIFYLNKQATGNFAVDIKVDTLNNYTINPVAEPLALFSIKKGQFENGTAHVEGNNNGSKASVAIVYRDLHITPLKADSNNNGKLKRKSILSFFANKLLIKDNNPGSNGQLRKPEYTVERDHHGNFFNFVWLSIMTGVLKTIGIPVKFVIK